MHNINNSLIKILLHANTFEEFKLLTISEIFSKKVMKAR